MPAFASDLQQIASAQESVEREVFRDAEFNLLVELCSWAIRGEPGQSVGEGHDWRRLVRLARRHRLQGLAWLALSGATRSERGETAELREDAKSIAQQNLLATAAAARLLDAFDREGLALIFVKGLTLGALAYSNAMLKMSTDIDILVDPAEIDAVEKCLRALGYEPDGQRRLDTRRAAVAKEWPWISQDGVVVDLHVRLADNPALLPAMNARSRSQKVEVSNGLVLPTLGNEELFAYLCVHGTSSAWFRLKWAVDLAAFLHGRSATEIRRLHAAARSHGAGRCADVALLVVSRLFGHLFGDDVLQELGRDPVAQLLTVLSLREILQDREPLERPLGTVLIHLGQLFIDRSPAFPLREFRRQFHNVVG